MEQAGNYERALKRLRSIREALGLTLQEVEFASGGRFKSSVIASYENGSRRPSLAKILEICTFYGVAIDSLFQDSREPSRDLIVDLAALQKCPADEISVQLSKVIMRLGSMRGDWNGAVFSIRKNDWATLAMVLDMNTNELADSLQLRGLLLRAQSRP